MRFAPKVKLGTRQSKNLRALVVIFRALTSLLASLCKRVRLPQSHMNVTLTIPDDLCREARNRAVGESKSLSSWIADLVAREVGSNSKPVSSTLLDDLGDESLAEGDLELPNRPTQTTRPVEFP